MPDLALDIRVSAPFATAFLDQVDPFYLRLFEEGKALYEKGKITEGVKNLEIAAFGLLEAQSLLLEAYIYLVNGQYRLSNVERAAFFLTEITAVAIGIEAVISGSGIPSLFCQPFREIKALFLTKKKLRPVRQ